MLTFDKANKRLMSQSGIDTESLELESFSLCILYSPDDRPKLVLNQLSTKTSCVFQEMWVLFRPVICGRPKCIAWIVEDGTRLSSPQMHLTVFVWFFSLFVFLSGTMKWTWSKAWGTTWAIRHLLNTLYCMWCSGTTGRTIHWKNQVNRVLLWGKKKHTLRFCPQTFTGIDAFFFILKPFKQLITSHLFHFDCAGFALQKAYSAKHSRIPPKTPTSLHVP